MHCAVVGCGKYSAKSKGFIILPKNLERAREWLKAAGLEKISKNILTTALTYHERSRWRFCKKHFLPTSFLNDRIADDAVPRLYLPATEPDSAKHHGVLCNKCNTIITDVRFKCITCEDFDLCRQCERQHEHKEHNMLRITKPVSTIATNELVNRVLQEFTVTKRSNSIAHLSIETTSVMSIDPDDNEISSDDEPITKYRSSYKELELPEQEKIKICNEVDRVLSVINKSFIAPTKMSNRQIPTRKSSRTFNISTQTSEDDLYPVEFADVNDSDFEGEIKNEIALDDAPESVPETTADEKLFNLLTS